METFEKSAVDYQRIEKAISFLEKNFSRHPDLHEIARSVHLSEYHFQRLFSRWVGLSPKRFMQFLTKEHAKELLRQSRNVLDVTFESGLSSPGRLHDLFVTCEAVTPGEFKNAGEELIIEYGWHPTPFGTCLLGLTSRGICALEFVQDGQPERTLGRVKKRWQNAKFTENNARTSEFVRKIFEPKTWDRSLPFHLHLRGTNFQIKVWEALLRVPYAHLVSYDDIATELRQPRAVRAVANAVGSNPVAFLIPCHRVIRKLGEFGGYAGGTARKKAIIGWEAARRGDSEYAGKESILQAQTD